MKTQTLAHTTMKMTMRNKKEAAPRGGLFRYKLYSPISLASQPRPVRSRTVTTRYRVPQDLLASRMNVARMDTPIFVCAYS